MKLQALDQIHISAVKPDALRPGEKFEVSDDLGRELLAKHPRTFVAIGGVAGKSERAPMNKAEPGAPSNKSKSAGK